MKTKAKNNKEVSNNSSNEWIDYPEILKILIPPVDSIELKLIDDQIFQYIKNKPDIENFIQGNIYYNDNLPIVYMKQDIRTTEEPRSLSLNLTYICEKFDIKELVLIKNKENAHSIRIFLRSLNPDLNFWESFNVEISIFRGVQEIKKISSLLWEVFTFYRHKDT